MPSNSAYTETGMPGNLWTGSGNTSVTASNITAPSENTSARPYAALARAIDPGASIDDLRNRGVVERGVAPAGDADRKPPRRSAHDRPGRDVAVNHAAVVRVGQDRRRVADDRQRIADGQRPLGRRL